MPTYNKHLGSTNHGTIPSPPGGLMAGLTVPEQIDHVLAIFRQKMEEVSDREFYFSFTVTPLG